MFFVVLNVNNIFCNLQLFVADDKFGFVCQKMKRTSFRLKRGKI